jgi:hypothetical protein
MAPARQRATWVVLHKTRTNQMPASMRVDCDCGRADFPAEDSKYEPLPREADDHVYEARWTCRKCGRMWKTFYNAKYDTYPSFTLLN